MITRCNLPSLNPAQSPLRHCLPLHSDEHETSFDTEIFREYFRKITARSPGRSGFQRLCRIIRGECVCHGPPRRRRRRVGVGCPRGWYSLLSETRGCYPTALTIRKRCDGRKNGRDGRIVGEGGGGEGGNGREAGPGITAGTLITSASASVISVNLQLIRNCRHRREEYARARRLHRIYRSGPMRTRCAIAGDEWAAASISLINGSGRNSMEFADADRSTKQVPAERIAELIVAS